MSCTSPANLQAIRRSVRLGLGLLQSYNTRIVPACTIIRKKSTDNFSHSKMHMQALQKQIKSQTYNETHLEKIWIEGDSVKLSFDDGSTGTAPFLWMRDNCQCSSCFDQTAQGRKSLLQDIPENVHPQTMDFQNNTLSVQWSDGHSSTFDGSWLFDRSFSTSARKQRRNAHKIATEPWDKNLVLDTFDYSNIRNNGEDLLDFLTSLEKKGISLITNALDDEDAGASLIDDIAFVKMSHYGRRSPVIVRKVANNVAWSNEKLGLHTDLTQYSHQAGIIFIQTVKQHIGKGGESIVSDGLWCSEFLKQNYPKEFNTLATTPIYFWDRGVKTFELELSDFYKISKHPVIGLDADGKLETLRINNQTRDSHLDIDPDHANNFYRALMLFNKILYENSYSFKMNDGDILVLDNVRCLHGREGFEASSPRHLESAYLDWDEARCRRRRLQEKYNKY